MQGAKLNQVDANKENAMRTGSYIHNFLEDDHRIYTNEVDNAMADKSSEEAKLNAQKKEQQRKQSLVQQQQRAENQREKKANQEMAIHFMDDDYVQMRNEESSSDSDSDSDSD